MRFRPTLVSTLVCRQIDSRLTPGYETTKRKLTQVFAPNPLPIYALLSAGATGGVCYWLACYPLDVAKSRIQLADRPPTRGGWASGGYVARELSKIVREEGG